MFPGLFPRFLNAVVIHDLWELTLQVKEGIDPSDLCPTARQRVFTQLCRLYLSLRCSEGCRKSQDDNANKCRHSNGSLTWVNERIGLEATVD